MEMTMTLEPLTTTLDPTIEALKADVAAAKQALLATAEKRRGEWWAASELKNAARNGWASGVMSLALNELVDDGALDVDEHDLRVRVS